MTTHAAFRDIVEKTLSKSSFHFFKPSLNRTDATERILSAANDYAAYMISNYLGAFSSNKSKAYDELVASLDLILQDREDNDMSDDMITIGNIEIALAEAKSVAGD